MSLKKETEEQDVDLNVEEPRIKLKVFVTAFGPFCGIPKNPTQVLLEGLRNEIDLQPYCEFILLETSAEGSLESLRALHKRIQVEDSVQDNEENDITLGYLFLHFGVDAKALEFKIECRGINEANFRVPDERGQQLQDVPVVKELHPTCKELYTSLPTEEIVRSLCDVYSWSARISDDAGRFVCNWVYTHNLAMCQNYSINRSAETSTSLSTSSMTSTNSSDSGKAQSQDTPTSKENIYKECLFIHVPPETVVPPEDLLSFARHLILITSTLYKAQLRSISKGEESNKTKQVEKDTNANRMPIDDIKRTVSSTLPSSNTDNVQPKLDNPSISSGDQVNLSFSEENVNALIEIGFSRVLAEQALRVSNNSVEEAMEWIFNVHEQGESDSDNTNNIQSTTLQQLQETHSHSLDFYTNFKMVCVVRKDLNMSKGKIAAQVAHGVLENYRRTMTYHPEILDVWQGQGEAVITLSCDSLEEMQGLQANALSNGLICSIISDAGRTEVEAGSQTVLTIGPCPVNQVDQVTGKLSLLR